LSSTCLVTIYSEELLNLLTISKSIQIFWLILFFNNLYLCILFLFPFTWTHFNVNCVRIAFRFLLPKFVHLRWLNWYILKIIVQIISKSLDFFTVNSKQILFSCCNFSFSLWVVKSFIFLFCKFLTIRLRTSIQMCKLMLWNHLRFIQHLRNRVKLSFRF